MLIYKNKKSLYSDLKITRYKFEKKLKKGDIIKLEGLSGNTVGYALKADFIKEIVL